MKKLFITLFIITGCLFTASAQDKAALQQGAERIYKNTTQGNYEALLDDTYPKIFNFIPKDQMLKMLQGLLKGDGYVMDVLEAPANFQYGEIKKIGDGSYCIIKHDLLSKMTFTQPVSDAESKELIANLKNAMHTDDVTFNPRSNSFTILSRADLIAVYDSSTGGKWKFMNKGGEKLMDKLFTKEVRSALGI